LVVAVERSSSELNHHGGLGGGGHVFYHQRTASGLPIYEKQRKRCQILSDDVLLAQDFEVNKLLNLEYLLDSCLHRLTPSLAMVALLSATLITHMGSGPFWPAMYVTFQESCEKNWWSTVTYLQNYVHTHNQVRHSFIFVQT
jgi:hypothetical protein